MVQKPFCNRAMCLAFAIHLTEDGHISGRNMWELQGVFNILSYIYKQAERIPKRFLMRNFIIREQWENQEEEGRMSPGGTRHRS